MKVAMAINGMGGGGFIQKLRQPLSPTTGPLPFTEMAMPMNCQGAIGGIFWI